MKARIRLLVGLLLVACVAVWWWCKPARDHSTRRDASDPGATGAAAARSGTAASPGFELVTRLTPELLRTSASPALSARGTVAAPAAPAAAPAPASDTEAAPASAGGPGPGLRLSNTRADITALARRETAVLLRNAFIDTASPEPLRIPEALRAQGDPGSYIVQSRGPAGEAFRQELQRQGVAIVSYIPNNAWLVRATAEAARQLAQAPLTQSVLPFEPYYKLEPALLELAAREPALPLEGWLNVTAFPGERRQALASLEALGAIVKGEGRSPFGPQFIIDPAPESLVALAALPSLQLLERYDQRQHLSDLTRVRLRVATDTVTNKNNLGLTGSNIWVNINDTGVDAQQPALKGRVFGDAAVLTDTNGHGTHMAGIIAGNGTNSPGGANNLYFGSATNASFRGMAPLASLFALPLDPLATDLMGSLPGLNDTNSVVTDTYLQETAARTNYQVLARTNALISNNSWGYGRQFDYDSAAASYDEAVRDALPDVPGPQAMIYVFAAGNSGFGNGVGQGGEPGSITSPGTAKNVITVGAMDNLRNLFYELAVTNTLTNLVVTNVGATTVTNIQTTNVVTTNRVFLPETDSDDQVAPYSSRGNVGIGLEGQFGRFKPDVVAPGAFEISLRPTQPPGWNISSNLFSQEVNQFTNQVVGPNGVNNYALLVPVGATNLVIQTLTNRFAAGRALPPLDIYARFGTFPTLAPTEYLGSNRVTLPRGAFPTLFPGFWFYSISNTLAETVSFDLRTILTVRRQYDPNYFSVLTNVDAHLRGSGSNQFYRAESGTSTAAAAISGLLALMQQYCESNSIPHSPALLKALLINGARTVSPKYNLRVRNLINYQGWGMPTLLDTLAPLLRRPTNPADWPAVNPSPTNALATGQAHVYRLSVPAQAELADLRVTLVWTDPPGNPISAIKLVNDLDLVVSNNVSHDVFVGNDISTGDFNAAAPTNGTPAFDNVNNVETVALRGPLGTNYAIYVIGRRVNVNAVTAHTNDIAQDYALVVSTTVTNALALRVTNLFTLNVNAAVGMTNGLPLLKQRVGANSPLLGGLLGVSNQWRFYAFTNSTNYAVEGMTNGPHVAFITFSPPNLSLPRNDEADIDLYVTRGDPGLLTLRPASVAAAYRSVKRGGNELVLFDDASIDEVFYVAVKAEDQNGSEYGLIGLSSQDPFESIDAFGNRRLRGLPPRQPIPDGSPQQPGGALVFAVAATPISVAKATVAQTIIHHEFGDLLGNLSHNNQFVVLNNHSLNLRTASGTNTFMYDDSRSVVGTNVRHTDGPGTLRNFLGEEGSGAWMLTMVDNALGHTGMVGAVEVRLEPNLDLLAGGFGSILPQEFKDYFIDVPADASLMTIIVSSLSGPLELFVRRDAPPTLTLFDKSASLIPPGGELSVGPTDVPPLQGGRYFIGLYNPGGATVTYFIRVRIDRNLSSQFRRDFTQTNWVRLGDDVLTVDTNFVADARRITDMKVGLRLDHPRASDLAIYLVSPQETRALLYENRGGTTRQQLGFEGATTNFHHVALTYSTNNGAAFYLDGEVQREWPNLTNLVLDTRGELHFGFKPDTNQPSAQYLGGLDEVDLYNRALAATEVRAIYKFGGAGKPTNGLVSRWAFDVDGRDSQTNANDARLLGPTFTAGKFAAGLDFSQAGDKVVISNRFGLDVGAGAGFTLDAWVNPSDLSRERPLAVWSRGSSTNGVEFFIEPGNDTNLPPGLLSARLTGLDGVTNAITAPLQGLIRTNGVATNLVYLRFTDDTNFALVPIKFGDPAIGFAPSRTNRFISGFEGVPALPTTNITTNGRFDGWTVGTNLATVLQAPDLAHTGTNLLVLRDAALTRTLPTVAGTAYRLQFAHRPQPLPAGVVSWWPGEDNALDSVLNNNGSLQGAMLFTNGLVGRGFAGATNTDYIRVEPSATLDLTSELTVELWFQLDPAGNGGGLFSHAEDPAAFNPARVNYAARVARRGSDFVLDTWYNDPATNSPLSQVPGVSGGLRLEPLPAPGSFHHFAATCKQITNNAIRLELYLDGELRKAGIFPGALTNTVGADTPLFLGATIADADGFAGVLDEITLYRRALGAAEIQEIYRLNAVGKRPARLVTQTRAVVGGANGLTVFSEGGWRTNSLLFLAASNGTPFELYVPVPPPFANVTNATPPRSVGAMLDSFELTEMASTDFLPEETIKPFLGELAAGNWRLEVYDRRVGGDPAVVDPLALSWQLQFTFAPPSIPLVVLTNRLAFTNIVTGGSVRYFAVDVPAGVTRVTNTLSATNALDLYFNQNGIPFGGAGTDSPLVLAANSAATVIATNGMWQVDPANGTPTSATNTVPQLQPGQRYYLAITNSLPTTPYSIRVDFNLPDMTPLTNGQVVRTNIAVTNVLEYYSFRVSTNAVAANFQITPTNGNVDLYIRYADLLPDLLPGPSLFDYASENPGAATDEIRVNQASVPVPLTAGTWYIGVRNADTNTVGYRIRVDEFTNAVQVIALAPGVALSTNVGPTDPVATLFYFGVTNSPEALVFDLENLDGDADLFVNRNVPPGSVSDYSDHGTPLAPAKIIIRTNAFLTDLNGDWYLAVTNLATNVNFAIRASFRSGTPPPLLLPDGVPLTGTVAADPVPDYYRFVVSPNAVAATVEVTPIDGDVDLVLSRGVLPDLTLADYSSMNFGLAPEVIVIDRNTPPVPLAPGDWYVAVYNRDAVSVTYTVKATQVRPAVRALSSGVQVTGAATNGVVPDVYRFTVSVGADQAAFNLANASGSLDLYLRYGQPFPGPGLFDYFAQAGLGADATINVSSNSAPRALAPGDWYITVVNTDPVLSVVDYSLTATETVSNPPSLVKFGGQVKLSPASVEFSWTSPSGLVFEVEYATTVPPVWQPVPNAITLGPDGQYHFTDDESQTGGRASFKMYRLKVLPAAR
jgi:subtilisin-like proprotein convertase family protein